MNVKFEILSSRFTIAAPSMALRAGRAAGILRAAWWYLRQITGDAAYENYLRSSLASWEGGFGRDAEAAMAGHGEPGRDRPSQMGLMSRRAFYLDSLRRRYTGVSRCC
jgi:hypothetical protein